jgi:BirA family biotin operon repressor/biotin-[acetyl-CoA-carboxylase] ligase
MASSQFAGKGQRGNNWISEPGKNLTFSVLLRPSFLPLNKAHLLTHLGGLAVLKTVASYCINTSIKWPNDIYVSNNKIAGVLVENVIGENKIKQCIMGIGLNVNQTDFPTVLDDTSLKKQTQMEHNLENVLNSICENIEEYYSLLATSQFEKMNGIYQHNLFLKNCKKRFLYRGKNIEAEIISVNEDGKLVLLEGENQIIADLHEISYQN